MDGSYILSDLIKMYFILLLFIYVAFIIICILMFNIFKVSDNKSYSRLISMDIRMTTYRSNGGEKKREKKRR